MEDIKRDPSRIEAAVNRTEIGDSVLAVYIEATRPPEYISKMSAQAIGQLTPEDFKRMKPDQILAVEKRTGELMKSGQL
jgi:hypothetical protein